MSRRGSTVEKENVNLGVDQAEKRRAFVFSFLAVLFGYLLGNGKWNSTWLNWDQSSNLFRFIPSSKILANSSGLLEVETLPNNVTESLKSPSKPFVHQYTIPRLLNPTTKCYAIPPVLSAPNVSILDALNTTEKMRKEKRIFVMLNGQNEGVYMQWDVEDANCIYVLAHTAALALGADASWVNNGLRMMDQLGNPITTAKEIDEDAYRIVHVLLDGQIWIWPGIKLGYIYTVNGTTIETLSLVPKVFSVKNFFSAEEAMKIREYGLPQLQRSMITSDDGKSISSDVRTSHTAFLPESDFTRDFQRRSANLVRLPATSCAETLQLVRYDEGQFYRRHQDFFGGSLLGNDLGTQSYKQYIAWVKWAQARVLALGDNAPPKVKRGTPLFPNATDLHLFQHSALYTFVVHANKTNYFEDTRDVAWRDWIMRCIRERSQDPMMPLLKGKPHYLQRIIEAWTLEASPELEYEIPTPPSSMVSQYLRWVRVTKEKIAFLDTRAPEETRPFGYLYPTYRRSFQSQLARFVLEDYSEGALSSLLNKEWSEWLIKNTHASEIVFTIVRNFPHMVEVFVRSWEKRAGPLFNYKFPPYVNHMEPNRFVTLFLYLTTVEEGGETVFPLSKERLVPNKNISRAGMDECAQGLAVPAIATQAALFYTQTPNNEVDPMSLHGGCPPLRGVKWGSNSFMWNVDTKEGTDARRV